MQTIGYYLLLPFIYLVSVLPFPVLYLFSDFVHLILFGIIGYRRKVIYTNLKNSFPEKSDQEIKKIGREFEHYLCDLFLETFKTLTISEKEMLRRCTISPEAGKLFDDYFNAQKNVIIVMGHFGNWEWAGNSFSLTRKHQLYVIYHPLKNKHFNDLIIGMRTRFGTKLIPMKDTMRQMLANRNEKTNATAFIADQTPHPDRAYWMNFMNQDTPVFMGTEAFAKKLNYPVIYVSVKKIRRGFYNIDADLLFEQPGKEAEYTITETHTKRLEKDIQLIPSIWLWSHKRWKHKRIREN
ncbi:MAG: lysophospholipid acyltransferase family protein [Bacteroidia bacterium]